jgi:hypothetical protein
MGGREGEGRKNEKWAIITIFFFSRAIHPIFFFGSARLLPVPSGSGLLGVQSDLLRHCPIPIPITFRIKPFRACSCL